MVIFIQDYLEHRRDAARQIPARLLAVAGGQAQTAVVPRLRARLPRASALVDHEQLAAAEPGTLPDAMTLYAEASLI